MPLTAKFQKYSHLATVPQGGHSLEVVQSLLSHSLLFHGFTNFMILYVSAGSGCSGNDGAQLIRI